MAHTIEILKGLRDRYESHHRVTITDQGLVAAANLADRYISDRHLPDKAIDLIDEAGSRLRIRRMRTPADYRELEDEIAAVRRDKEAAIEGQQFEKAAKLRDKEKDLVAKKAEMDERGLEQGVVADQERRHDFGVAVLGGVKVEHELAERPLQPRQLPLEDHEPGAGDPGRGFEIHAEPVAEFEVLLRHEAVRPGRPVAELGVVWRSGQRFRWDAVAANNLVGVLVGTDRHLGQGHVGDRRQGVAERRTGERAVGDDGLPAVNRSRKIRDLPRLADGRAQRQDLAKALQRASAPDSRLEQRVEQQRVGSHDGCMVEGSSRLLPMGRRFRRNSDHQASRDVQATYHHLFHVKESGRCSMPRTQLGPSGNVVY